MKQIYLILLLFFAMFITGCRQREYSNPGPSLIYLSFNNEIMNTGILPVNFHGDKYVSYDKGLADSCLNLSENARYRKPVIIDKGLANSFGDYEGLTIMLWVKSGDDDPNEYVITGQKQLMEKEKYRGWHISKTLSGSWMWEFSDGDDVLRYSPTHTHQPINDGRWHQIGFNIDKLQREARFYYDGDLKAVLSTESMDTSFPGTSLQIGSDPLAKDPRTETFNGMIDELGVWSRALSDDQVAGLFHLTSGKKLRALPVYKDSITVMTWNIRNGGMHQGKYVGVERVADIIRNSGADIVALQETMGSGEQIAGELDYFFYRRSANLSVLSRFAPLKSYNAFRPDHFGALNLDLGENKDLLIGPVWLSGHPNLAAYFRKENARADTIEVREMETRGVEANFLLSEIRPFIINSEQTPIVMAGDFNSGSHLDWTERNQERYNGLVVDFPATRFMEDAGFKDAYRQLFPDEVAKPGVTWSPIYKEGLQTRMDFIWYQGKKLIPTSASVINTHPLGFPSDHAAVVVSFTME